MKELCKRCAEALTAHDEPLFAPQVHVVPVLPGPACTSCGDDATHAVDGRFLPVGADLCGARDFHVATPDGLCRDCGAKSPAVCRPDGQLMGRLAARAAAASKAASRKQRAAARDQ